MKEKPIIEMLNERNTLLTRSRAIIDGAKKESRAITGEEKTELENNQVRIAEVDLEIEERKKINTGPAERGVRQRFSVLKVILSTLDGSSFDKETAAVIDAATAQQRNAGLGYSGIVIPAFEKRDGELQAGVATLGAETVPTDMLGLLEPLYDNQILKSFTILTGLSGNISIPSMSAGSAAWKGEIAKADAAGEKFASVEMKPKRLTTTVSISKLLLYQSNSNIEMVLRTDIQNAVFDKLQKTILGAEAASDTMPGGLFNGAGTISAVDFASLVEIEKEVEEANAVATGYIISPTIKATARQAVKASGQGGFLFDDGQLLGMPTFVTNASKGILYGALNDIVLGQWGNIDIVVDPYTLADNGEIKLTINSYWDCVKRRNTVIAKTIA